MKMHKKLLSVIFLVGIAAAGIIYYFRHRGDFYLITSVSTGAIVVISSFHSHQFMLRATAENPDESLQSGHRIS